MIAFYDLLYSCRLRQSGEDCIWWVLIKNGKFEVKLFYQVISSSRSPFSWRSIWRAYVPLRVSFVLWKTALGKIITLDNLRKKKVIVVEWFACVKRAENL